VFLGVLAMMLLSAFKVSYCIIKLPSDQTILNLARISLRLYLSRKEIIFLPLALMISLSLLLIPSRIVFTDVLATFKRILPQSYSKL
jgi:hypothetical protein